MCTVGCDASSGSEEEAVLYNIWNALLAALVRFRIGEALQPSLTAQEMGKVALTCRFACDALCAELCDWDEAERVWSQLAEGWQTAVAADPQRRAAEGSPGWENWAPARRFTACTRLWVERVRRAAGVRVRNSFSLARTVALSSHKSQEEREGERESDRVRVAIDVAEDVMSAREARGEVSRTRHR